MHRKFLFLLFTGYTALFAADSSGYAWPLKRDPVITSSFGEVRAGHIHSGIDLSTGGSVGVPVVAVEDAKVTRISFSPWGYGKALYLELRDGRVAVYGHLDHLVPALEKIVQQEQEKNGRYRLNLFLADHSFYKKNPVYFAKGERIAYSGQTGSGFPHLHFEIRDSRNNYPLNPLLYGFPAADSYPPVIEQVLIRPLTAQSTVESSRGAFRWKAQSKPDGNFFLADTPWVDGTVGLAVSAGDYVTPGGLRVCTYERRLVVDGRTLFSAGYDTLPYELSYQVLLDRDFQTLWNGEGKYENCYRLPGNKFPAYRGFPEGAGILDGSSMTPGLHSVEIQVRDVSGHMVTVSGTIGFGRAPRLRDLEAIRDSAGYRVSLKPSAGSFSPLGFRIESSSDAKKWSRLAEQVPVVSDSPYVLHFPPGKDSVWFLRAWVFDGQGQISGMQYAAITKSPSLEPIQDISLEWEDEIAVVKVSVSESSSRKPAAELVLGGTSWPVTLVRSSITAWTGLLPLNGKPLVSGWLRAVGFGDTVSRSLPTHPFLLTPQTGTYLVSPDSLAAVDFPAGCVSHSRIVEFGIKPVPHVQSPELILKSSIYSVKPSVFYLDKKVELEIRLSKENLQNPRIGLFSWNGKKWSFMERRINPQGTAFRAESRSLAPFAVMQDTVAPKISSVSIRPNRHFFSPPPEITFYISDAGSGIRSDLDIRSFLEGRTWINEYDPEAGKVTVLRTFRLLAGNHVLVLEVQDALGNLSRKEIPFRVERR